MTDSPAVVQLTVTDIAYGGDGVGHLPDGRAVFVPFTAIGDDIDAEIVSEQKSFARARLLAVRRPGPHRAKPHCPHYGYCGGCQYQHLQPAEQLRLKAQQYADALQRIGHLANLPAIEPVVASPNAYGYRNKIVLHPALDERRRPTAYGYRSVDNDDVLAIVSCPIAAPPLQEALVAIGADDLRNVPLTLRLADNGRVFRYYGSGPGRAPWLRESLLDRKYSVPLTSFAQVNPPVSRLLVEWLLAQLPKMPCLLDLYCGAGHFALACARKAERIVAIERDQESVHAARFNAGKWGIKNALIKSGPVEKVLPAVLRELPQPEATTVILDPPRAGCEKPVLDALAAWGPERIVYVSCNPASQARDLKRLLDQAPYAIERLALFDMFPQTAHFETVAILTRQ